MRPRLCLSFLTAIGVAFALFLVCHYGSSVKMNWDYLRVKKVEIKGNRRISPDQIKMLTGIKEGLNMLHFDLSCITSVAEAQPWIRSLVVERKFPSTVSIQVEEKLPAAIWEAEGKLFLMDEFGFLLEEIHARDSYGNLPLLTASNNCHAKAGSKCPFPYWANGLCIAERIKNYCPQMMSDVEKISIFSEDQVMILMTQRRRVLLSMSTNPCALPILKTLITNSPEQWETMSYCDLRFNGRIILG